LLAVAVSPSLIMRAKASLVVWFSIYPSAPRSVVMECVENAAAYTSRR
jgi:hypothetical protein